jgi:hypothetical protein
MKNLCRSAALLTCGLYTLAAAATEPPSPDLARSIAEDAYIYAYPMLESYRTLYVQALDTTSHAYKGPFNQFEHSTKLAGPESKTIVRPNNDTIYSTAWLDLHAEPIVIGVPEMKDRRYYSVQLVDVYTHNFGYIGSRTTGYAKGRYLIAGPHWKGAKPAGIDGVFQSEGNLVLALVRIALAGPADLSNVLALQKELSLVALSKFEGEPAPKSAAIDFPRYDQKRIESEGFIPYLNFLLGQTEPHPSEKDLLARFAAIGIVPGAPYDPKQWPAPVIRAIGQGVGLAKYKIGEQKLGQQKNGWLLIAGAFGDRERMKGRYLQRAAAAHYGLYGNDEEEAYYPGTIVDARRKYLEGKTAYVIRFEKSQLPPVNAFWSMTMYGLPSQLMVANPLKRYSIGDRTTGLVYGEDGSLTIYIQADSPGKDKESNWLPAPKGLFSLQFRMYWPKPEAFKPQLYCPPRVQRITS